MYPYSSETLIKSIQDNPSGSTIKAITDELLFEALDPKEVRALLEDMTVILKQTDQDDLLNPMKEKMAEYIRQYEFLTGQKTPI